MMKITKKLIALALSVLSILSIFCTAVQADGEKAGFELIKSQKLADADATAYYYRHIKTGAEVVYLDNGKQRMEFSIGFKTPPSDSKGANHVLEHGLFCGSEKYPTKNISHYVGENTGTSSLITNGMTVDDYTCYLIKTSNQTEFYNVMDVFMNGIFHPLLLKDENIFRQQGIRLEYADGKAKYNGVVYNELRIKSLDTASNSLSFLANQLYQALYGNTPPSFNSGGSIEDLKNLTYEDLLHVYQTYYIPSNSMTYLSGQQDIEKTLQVLDSFFSDFEKQQVTISFEDTKQLPKEPISEYNITQETKTVDIGFMSSGVPLNTDPKEAYARDMIFNVILNRMNDINPKNYVSGGGSGGISNLALLVSEVPVGRKEEIIASYRAILEDLETNGFDSAELETELDRFVADEKDQYLFSTNSKIFNGILYHNDPFQYMFATEAAEYLKEHHAYFDAVLKKYFTDNPYQKIVVSGNGAASEIDDTRTVSPEELEQLRRETEEFQKWADAPDDPAVIEQLPLLTLDEVKNAPEIVSPTYEEVQGISFYQTKKSGANSATLFFPLSDDSQDLNYVQLLNAYIAAQAQKTGLPDTYFGLLPMASYWDDDQINPQFFIGLQGNNPAAALQAATAFLQDETLWNIKSLEEYLKAAPDEIMKNGYRDPYYLSYDLMQSAQSRNMRFYSATTGSVQQGSPVYYRFLKGLSLSDAPKILEKLKQLAETMLLDSRPVVEYVGDNGYDDFQSAVTDRFKNASPRKNGVFPLPVGCNSAATITNLADNNHFMIAGCYERRDYSGKLAVLGKVLSANYIKPTMRGKYGAYGAGVSFRESCMVSSVAGLSDIDLAIDVWQGMGDYLRQLNITQNEVNAYIVSAVKEYEEYGYTDSERGAQSALSERTADDLERVRNEMLSTTVADLKGYADFVDRLVAQNRVFAVLGKSDADQAQFPFAYYADAATLEVTPRWKKNPQAYMSGKTETLFAPEDYITRAETAALLSRLSADDREPMCENGFEDISPDAWYFKAILSLTEKGVMSGYEGNTFLPEKNITRAELAAVLSNYIFQGKTELVASFSDLSDEAWYYEPMAKLINEGIMKGYEDGSLRPNDFVTRAQAVVMINRMLGLSYAEGSENRFDDVSLNHWAYQDITASATAIH